MTDEEKDLLKLQQEFAKTPKSPYHKKEDVANLKKIMSAILVFMGTIVAAAADLFGQGCCYNANSINCIKYIKLGIFACQVTLAAVTLIFTVREITLSHQTLLQQCKKYFTRLNFKKEPFAKEKHSTQKHLRRIYEIYKEKWNDESVSVEDAIYEYEYQRAKGTLTRTLYACIVMLGSLIVSIIF